MFSQQTNAYGEIYSPELNGHSFKKSSSQGVFEQFFKDTFDAPYQLYLIVGTDSGLLVDFIYKKYCDAKSLKGRKFVFFEQEAVIEQFIKSPKKPNATANEGFPEWLQVVPADSSLADLSADWVDYMMTKRIGLYKSIAVVDQFSEEVNLLWKSIQDQFANLRYTDAANNFSRPFVQAQLKNFPANLVPIKRFKGDLKGHKAILMAGGPSLDDTIEWIKSVQEHFFIFAVGRIAKKLINEGLTPDFIVSVDPHELSYDNSKHMFHFEENTILLNCYHIAPRLLSQWSGQKMYYGDLLPWQASVGNSSSPGPTVLHSALTQAAFLGCDEIYLSGADLCFYQGQTHTSGTAEAEIGDIGIQNKVTVETYSGEQADSDVPFAHGVKALNSIASYVKSHHNIQVYNLSPKAARVESVALCLLDEVTLPKKQDKQALLKTLQNALCISINDEKTQLSEKLKILQKERAFSVRAKQLATDGFLLIANKKKQAKPSAFAKAQKLRLKLDKHLDDKAQMIFHFGYMYFSEVLKPVEDQTSLTSDEKMHALFHYLEGMKKSLKDYGKLIDEVIAAVKFSQQELNPSSKVCDLSKQWQKQREPGRYKRWLNAHDWPSGQAQQMECLQQAQQLFASDLETTDTRQAKMIKAKAYAVVNLIEQIKSAFEHRDGAKIASLSTPIENLQNELDRKALELFYQAAHEAIESPGSEFATLKKIQHPKLAVFVQSYLLKHYMASEQHEQALQALQELCQYSDDYLIPYADYLQLLGRADLATELTLELFKKDTNNFFVLLKLVHFSHAAKQTAIFNDALTVALEQKPDHPELQPYV